MWEMPQIFQDGQKQFWVYGRFPAECAGEFHLITIQPDANAKGTLESDDPFFGEMSPEVLRERRDTADSPYAKCGSHAAREFL